MLKQLVLIILLITMSQLVSAQVRNQPQNDISIFQAYDPVWSTDDLELRTMATTPNQVPDLITVITRNECRRTFMPPFISQPANYVYTYPRAAWIFDKNGGYIRVISGIQRCAPNTVGPTTAEIQFNKMLAQYDSNRNNNFITII